MAVPRACSTAGGITPRQGNGRRPPAARICAARTGHFRDTFTTLASAACQSGRIHPLFACQRFRGDRCPLQVSGIFGRVSCWPRRLRFACCRQLAGPIRPSSNRPAPAMRSGFAVPKLRMFDRVTVCINQERAQLRRPAGCSSGPVRTPSLRPPREGPSSITPGDGAKAGRRQAAQTQEAGQARCDLIAAPRARRRVRRGPPSPAWTGACPLLRAALTPSRLLSVLESGSTLPRTPFVRRRPAMERPDRWNTNGFNPVAGNGARGIAQLVLRAPCQFDFRPSAAAECNSKANLFD